MDAELALHVGTSREDFSRCVEIDRDIYVFADAGTQYKILALRRFFALYGKDPEELVFYMKETDKPVGAGVL